MRKLKTPVTYLRPSAKEVKVPASLVSYNVSGPHVKDLQIALAYLGYKVDSAEYAESRFGFTTLKALNAFQEKSDVPMSPKFNSQSRKALASALISRNPNLRKQPRPFVIKGSVRDKDGNPLADAEVTVSYVYCGKTSIVRRTTNNKGFYHIQVEAPKDKSGIAAERFNASIEIHTEAGNKDLVYSSEMMVVRRSTWKNFGRHLGPTEYDKVTSEIVKLYGLDDFSKILNHTVAELAKSTGLDVSLVEDMRMAWSLDKEMKDKGFEKLNPEIFYGIVRKGGLGNLTLKTLFLTNQDKVSRTIVSAAMANVIKPSYANADSLMKLFVQYRNEYVLTDLVVGNVTGLDKLLDCAGIPDSLNGVVVEKFVEVGNLNDDFIQALPSSISDEQRRVLAKYIALYHLEGDVAVVNALYSRLKGFHAGWIAMLGDDVLIKCGVKDIPALRKRIAETYPEQVFINEFNRRLPQLKSLKSGIVTAVKTIYSAVGKEDPKDRFVLSDMKMTDTYVFDRNSEANDRCRTDVRTVQRLYRISDDVNVVVGLLDKGITSAVAAYYKGQAAVNVPADVWKNIENLYWKTISLYNDMVDAAKESSHSVLRSSANLRNLFGSVDSYTYDESLSLLSPAAYLVDLLRFLQCVNAENIYKKFITKRADIPFILLNKENSEILIPQIDNICEVLEDKVCGIDWSKMQTSGNQKDVLAVPQFTNVPAYRQLASSAMPVYRPYFNLPQTQIREILKELGAPRYELMRLAGAPAEDVAAEYFGMSKDAFGLFNGSVNKGTWDLDISSTGGVACVYLNKFLNASGLEYAEAVRILNLLDISLSDPDPEGVGYPDTDRQFIQLKDVNDDFLRLQRFIMILKASGISVDELKTLIDDPEVGNGEMDAAFVTRLMEHLVSNESDAVGEESVLDEYFKKNEISVILDKDITSLPHREGWTGQDIDRKAVLCAAVAQSRSIDQASLEAIYDAYGESYDMDSAASLLLTSAIICEALAVTADDYMRVLDVYGSPVLWDRNTLEDAVTVLVFNGKYKLDGQAPIVANPNLKAEDCIRAEKIFGYLKATGLDSEAKLLKYATVGDFDHEYAMADELLEHFRNKSGKGTHETVRKVMDKVRVAKRDALTGYLLAGLYKDFNEDDLMDALLLDVKMGPEQETTRIKMATNAVQLFVQRCMLGLEEGVTPDTDDILNKKSEDSWSQWSWLKNYRVWEAARKIFLFPENWLDPELRDGQTPEFIEFLNALDENQLADDKMEDAVAEYLYKLDAIAHLEVCAMHRQLNGKDDIWHFIARTRSATPVYYYRSYDNNMDEWTAWEKIDVEIEGDQIVPVIYNNRLYLFWLKFYQKQLKLETLPSEEASNKERQAPQPAMYHEIQLAWTYRKAGEWMPFTCGKQKLIHPWNRPRYAYDMKPFIDKFNRLHLDIYLTTSPEFNGKVDSTASDYYKDAACRYSANPHFEGARPWHSSSFIFEGDVTDVLLKDVSYNDVSSLAYVQKSFGQDGAVINALGQNDSGPKMLLPSEMHMHSGRLVNNKANLNENKLNTIEVVPELLDIEHVNDIIGKKINSLGLDERAPGYKGTVNKYYRIYRDYLKEESSRTRTLLDGAKAPFELVMSKQSLQMNSMQKKHMMVYQDKNRSFFFRTLDVRGYDLSAVANGVVMPTTFSRYCNYTSGLMYHPYAKAFIKLLREKGMDGVFDRDFQLNPWEYDVVARQDGNISRDYKPSAAVSGFPMEDIDFSYGGAYGIYNWELFFHMPLTVACRLSQNQKFEEAMKWFHFIFNPMAYARGLRTPECYWVTRPFYETALHSRYSDEPEVRVEALLQRITSNSAQLAAWKNNPFSPHIIARYRTVAYQKSVVLKYVENLLNWADMKFREDTMESLNEATQLYVLAYEILGKRPCKVSAPDSERCDMDFRTLSRGLDAMGNSNRTRKRIDLLLKTESLLDPDAVNVTHGSTKVPTLDVYYFDVPENAQIEAYWDHVEDRLTKLRASLNIDGVFRKLNINAPMIDPSSLVKAAYGGYSDFNAGDFSLSAAGVRPPYKFRTVLGLAEQMCSEVRLLGDKFLSAIEKMDAEHLAYLRAEQEKTLLKNYEDIRKAEIKEIEASISSLEVNLSRAEFTRNYYLSQELSSMEKKAISLTQKAANLVDKAVPMQQLGAGLSAAGNILAGIAGISSPVSEYEISFTGIGQGMSMTANSIQLIAGKKERSASIISTKASYERRQMDWTHQAKLAKYEMDSLSAQIDGAKSRLYMAERNLQIHYEQVNNAEDILQFMTNRFTNKKLYNWMKTELFKSYTKAYSLAYELAKKAELCYEYERGEKSGIITAESWNAIHDGLLAGDILMQKINQLKVRYYESNKRDYELVKRIPLSTLPSFSATGTGSALMDLIYHGECEIEIPEWMFDMDYEKHYYRTIKNVSLNIPCVVGPNTNVNCTLTMIGEAIRKESAKDAKPLNVSVLSTGDSIATSTAVNDSGVFDVNFNDERYLPFEGYGAVSRWRVALPLNTNHFDRTSISDVILNICYTSRLEGVADSSHGKVDGRNAVRVISVRHELQSEWRRIRNGEKVVETVLTDNLYPYWLRAASKDVRSVYAETIDKRTSARVLTDIGAKVSFDNEGNLKLDISACDDVRNWTDVKIVIDAIL